MATLFFASTTLADGDGPLLVVDGPTDGDWFTAPGITVEGTVDPRGLTSVLNVSELGSGDTNRLTVQPWGVVYTPSPFLEDEFLGNALNTSLWTVLRDDGIITVNGGVLTLTEEWVSYRYYYPSINSSQDFFAIDHSRDWEAEFRMMHVIESGIRRATGGGITCSTEEYPYGHFYAMGGNIPIGEWNIWIYENRTNVYKSDFTIQTWHTYLLRYDSSKDSYSIYMDGILRSEFEREDPPDHFWFGSPDVSYSDHFTTIMIDSARVWTYHGSWESRALDMDGKMVLTGVVPNWTTTRPNIGKVRLQVQVSSDNSTWSSWTDVRGGAPITDIEGRYLRFRADLSMPFVKDGDQNVTLSSLALVFHYPVASLEYNNDGSEWSPIPVMAEWSFGLTLHEDWNHLMIRATDTGRAVNSTQLDLLLDTTPPTGTVEIDGGALFTGSLDVTVSVFANDTYGITKVHLFFYIGSQDIDVLAFQDSFPFLLEGIDGPITLFVKFEDIHGLLSAPVSDDIILDTTDPTGSIEIDGGAAYTGSNEVTLSLSYSDKNGLTSIEVSNDAGFSDPQSLAGFVEDLEWDLGMSSDGTAWVYLRLVDPVGNELVVNASIEMYFPKAEGTITIHVGVELTNGPLVSLDIMVPPSLKAQVMQVSEDETFVGVPWQEFSERTIWTLSAGDGPKTVYVRFEDFRGIISLPVSDGIMVDRTPPKVVVSIDLDAEFAIQKEVQLTIEYDDLGLATDLWVSNSDDRGGAERMDYQRSVIGQIPDIEGERSVHVWVMDQAGNIGSTSDVIHYASFPPTIGVTLPVGDITNADVLAVDLDVSDRYGPTEVRFAVDRDPSVDDHWMSLDGDLSVDISGLEEGDHQVRVVARNGPGLMSQVLVATFVLDRTAPDVTILEPRADERLHQGRLTVRFIVQVSDIYGTTVTEVRVDQGEWAPVDPSDPFDVRLAGYGDKRIEVRAIDEAGNIGTASVSFTLEEETSGTLMTLMIVVLVAIIAVAIAAIVLRRSRMGDPGEPETDEGWEETKT
jgi:hypothetical protein